MTKDRWLLALSALGLVVQWDPATGEVSGIDQIRPGFAKRDEIAWVGTHRHVAAYEKLRIMAMTAVKEPRGVSPAHTLYAADLPAPKR